MILTLCGQDAELFAQKKYELRDRFEMKDMEEVRLILGIEVERDCDEGTAAITQKSYIGFILERFGMQDCNPVSTPGYGPELSAEQPNDTLLGAAGTKFFQSSTGSLLYLAQGTGTTSAMP